MAQEGEGQLEEQQADRIGLRVWNAGRSIPGQVLRLDLYRLVCYFHTSQHLSELSDWGDFCPWQSLRDDFESSEIIRILRQTAVAVSLMASGNADEDYIDKPALEFSVGSLFKSVGSEESAPLALREACNKIIHARNIVFESNGEGNPYARFLKPQVNCFEDFRKTTGWRAEIDVYRFVDICSSVATGFA